MGILWWRKRERSGKPGPPQVKDVAQVKAAASPLLTLLLNGGEEKYGATPNLEKGKYLQSYGDSYPWIYACVDKLATNIAALSLGIYKQGAGGALKPLLPTDPAALLLSKPNPYYGVNELIYLCVADQLLTGDAYWLKLLTQSSKVPVAELWRLNPDTIRVQPGGDWIAGYLQSFKGKTKHYEPEEIIHFRRPDPNSPWYGLPPVKAAALSADADKSAATANWNLSKRGLRPDYFASIEGYEPKDNEDVRDRERLLQRRFEGKDGGITFIPPGTTLTPANVTPRDMIMEAMRRMSREEVCAVFHIPPIMVGIEDHSTYSNYQQAAEVYWGDTIGQGWCPWLEARLNEHLLPHFGPGLVAQFDLSEIESLQDSDLDERQADWQVVMGGGLTPNEWRAKYEPDLDPLDDGDVRYIPAGVFTGTVPAEGAPAKSAGDTEVVVPPFRYGRPWDRYLEEI